MPMRYCVQTGINRPLLGETVISVRYRGAATLLAVALVLAGGSPAWAQYVVGETVQPDVEVDTSVLERLGREPTLPEMLLGRQPAAQRAMTDAQPAVVTAVGPAPRLHRLQPITLHKPIHKALHKHDPKPAKVKLSRHGKDHPAKAAAATKKDAPAKADALLNAQSEPSLPHVTLPVIVPHDAPATQHKTEPSVTRDAMATNPDTQPKALVIAALPAAESAAASAKVQAAVPSLTAASPVTPVAPVTPVQALSAPMESAAPAALAAEAAASTPVQPIADAPQQARIASAPAAGADAPLSIPFEKEEARLPDETRGSLAKLVERLTSDASLQIQLLAYAQGEEDDTSKARRLSLSRALAVRSFLIDQGVRSTRIEVRALGNKVPEGPADRVDVVVQKR